MYDQLDAEPAAEDATQAAPTITAEPPAAPKRDSAVVDAFAWSEEPDEPIEEPAPYPADDYYDDPFAAAAPPPARAVGRPRHRLPRLVLGLGVAVAATGVTYGLTHQGADPAPPQPEQDGVVTSTLPTSTTRPAPPTSTRPPVAPPPTSEPAPEPTSVPPEPVTTEAPRPTEPPRTTVAPPRSTAPHTTVAPSTTAPPATVESPSPSAEPPPTETPSPTVSMTTEYLRIPLVPVPIPITVPQP